MTIQVDARGLSCPMPVIRLAAAVRELPAGTCVTVLWTDPAAAFDIPAWARMRGHAVVADPAAPDGEPGSRSTQERVRPPAPAVGRTTVVLGTHDGPTPTGAGPS